MQCYIGACNLEPQFLKQNCKRLEILVNFTWPQGQLVLGSRIIQGSRISVKFGTLSLAQCSFVSFLGQATTVFKEDLNKFSDQFGQHLSSRMKKLWDKRVSEQFCYVYKFYTKLVSTCSSTSFISESFSFVNSFQKKFIIF